MRSFFSAIAVILSLIFIAVMVLYKLEYAIPVIIGGAIGTYLQIRKEGGRVTH